MMVAGFAWPQWLGPPSQFIMFLFIVAAVIVAYFKVWPKLKELNIGQRGKERDELLDRIRELKDEVRDCRAECDAQERRLQERIDDLQTRLNNEVQQRVQSEISLVSTMIQVVDAPQLRIILKALESRQVRLLDVEQLGPILGDTDGEGAEGNGNVED